MPENLSPSAHKVQDALDNLGFDLQVVEHTQTARTSEEAAATIGCQVAEIAKSLVFKTKTSEKSVLVIASGVNRVNEKIIKTLVGEKITRPGADFVRQHTGFAIGGVPPVGHTSRLTTFIDEDLLQFTEIWVAAGTPNAVFKLTPDDLVKMTGGEVISIK